MKKFFTLVVLALLAVGCAKEYDDTGLRELIAGLDVRVGELESSVSALQSALGDGKFVRKVEEYKNPDTGRTTGVTVTYTDGNVVYFTIVPTDPSQGPVFSVIRNGAGELVWAVDGQAIQVDGEEVPVYQTPAFSIDDEGNLWVEVDGKRTNLGPVKSEGATLQDGIFTNLAVTDEAVVLTLSDGSTVNIPFAEAFVLNIEQTEYTYSKPEAITVPYTVGAKTANTVVGVAGYSPMEFSVEVDESNIVITPLTAKSSGVLLAYADSKVGLTSIVSLFVEAEGFEITDEPYDATVDYLAEGEDAVVTVNAVSNIAFDVIPVDEWIHVVSVKSQAYVITLKLDDNLTGAVREGTVKVVKAGTDEVVQTIKVAQLPAVIEAGPADLGKKGTANSYIVAAAGEYKFKAVKGNSTESVGAVAKVEVLWETENSDAAAPAAGSVIASVAYADDYITFSTPETLKPGGAVIVAKDASDAILWNWFIWIPKTEIGHVDNPAFFGKPLMDRNLGALDKATTASAGRETYGMYYQWGRMNPLPGKALATAEFTMEEGPKSTAFAIANPTVFIKVSESDSAGNWNEEDLPNLWEDDSQNKAVYDPCPPGYKVPSYDAATGLWVNGNDGWTYSFDANYYAYGDAVFPMAGWYSSSANVGYEKERSIILSATAHSNPRARLKIIRKDKDGYYYANYFKQEAASVRCAVIDEIPGTITPGGGGTPEAKAVDLSENGTANSYIVTEAGKYKIALVKGNTEESVGSVASAEILWETWNNQETVTPNSVIASVAVEEDYITFSTPDTFHAGNALIAAKDASGTVLWSWHIWLPSTPVTDVAEAAFSAKNTMSRHLGALVDVAGDAPATVESFGLLYEWGRKDPFPGLGVLSGAGAITVAGTVSSQEGPMSVEDAVKNPNVYVYVAKGDWAAEGTDTATLWGETAKTVYDPCPVGYMLPQRDKSCAFWSGTKWTESTDPFVLNEANCSYSVGSLVFPISGYIDDAGEGQKKAGTRTIVWSGRWDSGTVNGYGLYGYTDDGVAFRNQGNVRSRGGSVRCVVE